MALDNVKYDAILKELYPVENIEQALYQDHAFLGIVNKNTNFQGKRAILPLQYARPQNRSATASTAFGGTTSSEFISWQIDMAKNYGSAVIDNLTLMSSKTQPGAFRPALETEMDSALDGLARNLNEGLFGDGSGRKGQRASDAASVTTLTNVQDIVRFELGQVIVASPNADGSSVRAGSITITSVDRDLGTIGYTGSITGYADNDFLFQQGDIGLKMNGLGAWLPTTAPGSTLFNGVDRSADTTRLGGVRYNGSSQTVREALYSAATRVSREGGRPDHVFMNPDDYRELQFELEADSIFDKAVVSAKGMNASLNYNINYDVIQISGPKGKISVHSDIDCPVGFAYMVQLNTWELYCIDSPVFIYEEDGTSFLRVSGADELQVRVQSYANLACRAPGKNAVVTLPALP